MVSFTALSDLFLPWTYPMILRILGVLNHSRRIHHPGGSLAPPTSQGFFVIDFFSRELSGDIIHTP